MTLYEFLKPLQESKIKHEEINLYYEDVEVYKGKIEELPFKYFDTIIVYWSYNFKDRLNVKTIKNNNK